MRTRGGFLPLSPGSLTERVATHVAALTGTTRVAVDGPPSAEPHTLAAALVAPLHLLGRPVAHVRAESFWRDASLRFEFGKHDPDEYLNWLDAGALRREVLDAVLGAETYLPSLRDPVTNRATRAQPLPAPPGTVVIVSGALLLGRGLPFELSVHLAVSPAARERRTPAADAWTLPAFERYDAEVLPEQQADIVVRLDDPRHPAVAGLMASGR